MIYRKQLSLILEKLDHILWRKCPLGLGECWSLQHYHRRFSGLRLKWAPESELELGSTASLHDRGEQTEEVTGGKHKEEKKTQ